MTLTFLTQFLNATLVVGLAWCNPAFSQVKQAADALPDHGPNIEPNGDLLRRYRFGLCVIAACWLVTSVAVHSTPQALLAHHLMPVLATVCILWLLRRLGSSPTSTRAQAIARDSSEAMPANSTSTQKRSLAGHPWALWLLALALVAAMNTHVAHHYGKSADATLADTWIQAANTWGASILPLVALATTALCFALSFLKPTSYSTSPHQEVKNYALATATQSLRGALAITAVACNALFLVLVVDLVPDNELNQATFFAALSFIFAAIIAVSLWLKKRAATLPPGLEPAGGEDHVAEDNKSWKWNLLYFNGNNPNAWVGSRHGFGHTLNFARWEVWLLASALMLPLTLALTLALDTRL